MISLAGIRIGRKPIQYAVGIAVIAAMPYALQGYPATVMFLAQGLIMAIAALGFNLLLGYTGLLSFGHAAFFGVGAYTVAFMVKYLKISSMELYLIAAIGSSALIGLAFGYLCVRRTRIFFAILTLALAQVLWSLYFKLWRFTGGTDGIRVPTPLLFGIKIEDKLQFLTVSYFYYILLIFTISLVVMWFIVSSPFGKALQAIRDNELRATFAGVNAFRHKLIAFVISGVYTGIAGALFAPFFGHVTPDIAVWIFSGEIVFATVLGGFVAFEGPILGGIIYTMLKNYVFGQTLLWQMVLGLILVTIVIALPTGIMGGMLSLKNIIGGMRIIGGMSLGGGKGSRTA